MLNKIRENWFFIGLFLVVLTAIYFPSIGIAIKDYIKYLIAFGMFLIGLRLNTTHIIKSVNNAKALALCTLSSFLIMPLISFILGLIFFKNNPIFFVGIILAGAAATTQASSIIWTDQSKGNTNLALVLMAVSNIIAVFLMPIILVLFLGKSIVLPVGGMIKTLVLIVLLPTLAGVLLVYLSKINFSRFEKPSRIINIGIIWLIVLTAFSNSNFELYDALCAFIATPLQYGMIASLSYFGSKGIGLNKKDSIAVMFCSSQKTITTASVIALTYFDPGTIIYLFIYHVFQQAMGQIHARLFTRNKT